MTCFSFLSRKRGVRRGVNEDESSVPIYTYKELKTATNDFRHKIGQGGFCSVYKGKLKDGTTVAVKVLASESKHGVKEFLHELQVIANVVHENLVRLRGCCLEDNHRILVYNYLENNSLAQTLLGGGHTNIQFSWPTRTKICIGVARGLAYLHESVRPRIVHRDIKASNILLDKDLIPKISDFGLAKLMPADMTHVSTRVAGTVGYLAPEYALRGHLTKRADTYSFGVLLLEIVTGRCNTNIMLPSEDCFLLERMWVLYISDNLISIVDAFLNGEFDEEEACRFLKIGLLCTQDTPKQRPIMSDVVKMLIGEKPVNMENITKPSVISDLTELKIKNQKNEEGESGSSSSCLGNSSTKNTNTNPSSFSIAAKSDQDE